MGMFKDCGCGCKGRNQQKKFITSAVAGLLFFIVANPETFMIVRKFLGNWVANQYGTPTMYGLLFHAFVFIMITWAMMNIGGRGKENADGSMEPGPPPQPRPGRDPVPNDTNLPPVPDMSQPIADTPAIPSTAPDTDSSSMSYMNTIFGGSGKDLNVDQTPLSGSNWTSCSCKNGTQVMVLGS